MSVIYNVTIEPTAKENIFQVTWQNEETGKANSFESTPEITTGETRRLWQNTEFQLPIGQKLFRFLDGETQNFRRAMKKAKGKSENLQLHLNTCRETHDWPFELLAKDGTFLLSHRLHLVRNVSDWGKEKRIHPKDRPLKLLFMACSAIDVKPVLDFEREEEAIFKITGDLPIHMEVEDSGSLEGLQAKLEREEYDVLHLSGHANIDQKGRPYFLMEDETGRARQVYPVELWNKSLIENPPRLIFLSGSQTGEAPAKPGETGNTAEGSFARLLVERYRVPAVLSWGRSVSDTEAAHAGKMIFHELSNGKTILEAVQQGRNKLITDFPGVDKAAWPMLRLFSSGIPLKSIVKKNQTKQPQIQAAKYTYLNNSQVKVLTEGFVGRRRQLQTALGALKPGFDKVGVMLLGTGGLGKSCLAGKICERLTEYTLIIVHGKFNTTTLARALKEAFNKTHDKKGLQILSQKLEMKDKLPNLCATSFLEKNYLLLLDDFEQNLAGVEKRRPGSLLPEAAELLDDLLHYLPFNDKMTQLIITCRYEFTMTESGRDPVEEQLENIWLTSFREPEQLKKVRGLKNIQNYENQKLVPRLLASGHGNPRLMERLDKLVGEMESAEVPQLLGAIKGKQEEFIHEHVIRELLQRVGSQLKHFLSWLSIYRRPVPLEGVRKVSGKAGLSSWQEMLKKGMGLGLAEHDQVSHSYQVTPLLREELLKGLEQHHACHGAAFDYYQKVCEARDTIDPILTEEWIFHALGCGKEEVATVQGSRLVNHLRDGLAFLESRRVGEWVLAEKNANNRKLTTGSDATLLNALSLTINDLGQHRKAIEYYQQTRDIWTEVYGETHQDVAAALNNLGLAWDDLGEHRKAIEYYQQAFGIDETVFGQKHPNVAIRLNNLGSAWYALGEHCKAIEYFQQALDIWKEVYGEIHPEVATMLNNLGAPWYELGDYQKAGEYYQQALEILKKVYGETHPQVAITLNNLGATWGEFGNYHRAIDYFQQALEIDEAEFGQQHHKVAIRLNNLAGVWHALGNHHKAIDNSQKALEINEAVFGKKHPDVAIQLNNLGAVWDEQGEHHKAIDYYQQALEIDKAVFGKTHPQVAAALNNLALAWGALNKFEKAKDYYEQAQAIKREIYGEESPEVTEISNALGHLYLKIGEKEKAKNYLEKVYKHYNQALGPGHQDTKHAHETLRACDETHQEESNAGNL